MSILLPLPLPLKISYLPFFPLNITINSVAYSLWFTISLLLYSQGVHLSVCLVKILILELTWYLFLPNDTVGRHEYTLHALRFGEQKYCITVAAPLHCKWSFLLFSSNNPQNHSHWYLVRRIPCILVCHSISVSPYFIILDKNNSIKLSYPIWASMLEN